MVSRDELKRRAFEHLNKHLPVESKKALSSFQIQEILDCIVSWLESEVLLQRIEAVTAFSTHVVKKINKSTEVVAASAPKEEGEIHAAEDFIKELEKL